MKCKEDKTWWDFRVFFSREFLEVRTVPRTTTTKLYGQYCFLFDQANTAIIKQIQTHHKVALENLSTTTGPYIKAVTLATITNVCIMEELQSVTKTIALLRQRVANCHCAPTTVGTMQPARAVATLQWVRAPLDPNTYFWLYGYCVRITHNSWIGSHQLLVNKMMETRANTMGGITKKKHHKWTDLR